MNAVSRSWALPCVHSGSPTSLGNLSWWEAPLQRLTTAASIGSQLWIFPAFLGLILGSTGLVNVGLVLFLAVVLFQLVTLPVEFDASHRAIVALEGGGLLGAEELSGARKVLQAAALTYIAALAASIGQLIYFVIASRR